MRPKKSPWRMDYIEGFNLMVKFLKSAVSIFLLLTVFSFVVPQVFGEEEAMEKTATVIELPQPALKGNVSIEETIQKRRSVRNFSDKPLSTEQVSQLLWATQGITDKRGLRAAPSAGALYPLEVYLVSRNGVFHYIPEGHKLEIRSTADVRQKLVHASWGQKFIAQASMSIVICAVYERVTSRYGERGIRYVDIEIGHAAENLHLQAVALGLASVPIGAFDDEVLARVLNLPAGEKPVYIIPVGYAK